MRRQFPFSVVLRLLVAVYNRGHSLVVNWGTTAPFNYDFFLVHWDLNGSNFGRQKVNRK